jgi:hypothetical protein
MVAMQIFREYFTKKKIVMRKVNREIHTSTEQNHCHGSSRGDEQMNSNNFNIFVTF